MNSQQDRHSHLFLVRFWSEEAGGHKRCSGRVQHVLSGEARTFDDWHMLVDLLLEMAETEGIRAGAPVDGAAEASRKIAQ